MIAEQQVRCSFYIRTRTHGGFHYAPVEVRSGPDSQGLTTQYPPVIGDLINLPGGVFVVTARAWSHSKYGSSNWPPGASQPILGPLLDVIVQVTEGPFVAEVPEP